MQWERLAIGLGRATKQVGLSGALVGALLLSRAPAVGAGDSFYGTSFFAGGLTAQSSWEQILKTPAIYAEFPMLNLGKSFMPVSALCVEGDMLRAADPRMDNGVRVSVATVAPAEERPVRTEYSRMRADLFSVSDVRPQARPEQVRSDDLRYSVTVYKVVTGGLTTEHVRLFAKPWEVPPCATP